MSPGDSAFACPPSPQGVAYPDPHGVEIFLLHCLELFSLCSFSGSHSFTVKPRGLALDSPFSHWKHNCELPWCKFLLQGTAEDAFLRHLQLLKLGSQLDLGAHTGRKVNITQPMGTPKQLIFQGAQGNWLFSMAPSGSTLMPWGSDPQIS